MHQDSEARPQRIIESQRRYCPDCGEIFDAVKDECPECGAMRFDPPQLVLGSLAAVLTDLAEISASAGLDEQGSSSLRRAFERTLLQIRPPRRRPVPAPIENPLPGGANVAAAVAAAQATATPSIARRAPGPTLGQLTAARQADILLYLGAFLLSVAALVFVGYQGQTLGGSARLGILAAYTLAFLAIGLALPRWHRVREAGAVFLALGALLVPVDFVALRVLVLNTGQLPDSAVWLAGSTATAALLIAIALRGCGRLYLVLGALAAVVAWGALGAVFNLPVEWFGAWFVGSAALIAVGWTAFDVPGRPAADAGVIAITVPALLFAQSAAFSLHQHAELPTAYLLAIVALGASAYRRDWLRSATLPALFALSALSGSWAVFGLSPVWFGTFLAGAGFGYLALAEMDREHRLMWRQNSAAAAVVGLAWAHAWVAYGGAGWALPLTYAIVLIGSCWDAERRRDVGVFLPIPVAAITVSTALWAAGVGTAWLGMPPVAGAIVLFLTQAYWRRTSELERSGWRLVPALAVAPTIAIALFGAYSQAPLAGLISFILAGAITLAAALGGSRARVSPWLGGLDERTRGWERQGLMRVASALLFGAAAYFNLMLGLHDTARAWPYAAIGLAAWGGLIVAGGGMRELFSLLSPLAVTAMFVAGSLSWRNPSEATILMTAAALGPALASTSTKRWSLWLIAAVFGTAAIAFGWQWGQFQVALLPLAYAACAALLTGLLSFRRGYESDERSGVITTLSWAPWLVSLGTAAVLLYLRVAIDPGVALVRTREWAVLTIIVGAAALALTLEGLRLHNRDVSVAGTAGLLAAGLLGIAVAQPSNIQAYALPLGIYLVALGMTYRRTPPLFGEHMASHEGIIAAGIVCLALPQAAQSFATGSQQYLLELVAEGAVFLILGFILAARWLVAGGVLTYAGIAIRVLELFGTRAPYWLTLAVVGMACLGIGVLLLLQRERWDGARRRLSRWWLKEEPA